MTPELLEDLGASFARDLRAADKSPNTIRLYTQAVRFFIDWLKAKGRPVTTESLTKHAIAGWLGELAESRQPGTVKVRYRGMRRFVKWAIAEGEIDHDPMANLHQPTVPDKPVPLVTDDEIAALIKTCDGKTFQGRRDEAIIRVLFDCGPRISELAGLTVDAVDLDHEVIHVIGKGRRARSIPFGAKTSRAIDRYKRFRRKHRHADADGFFLGERGPLTADGIDDILRQRAKKAGLDGLHAHRFRHTMAHDFLLHGGQERDLKRLAGWRSDAMLERYGSAAAVERAHAAARRLKRGDRI